MQAIKELEFGELEEPLRDYLDQVKASHRSATTLVFCLGTRATHASAFPPPPERFSLAIHHFQAE